MEFSVLISVYKKDIAAFFDCALSSVWTDQTLKPSEIILVKDGVLTSELDAVVYKWEKIIGSRLRVIALEENVGLASALNEGLKFCTYDLVARMDSDDISLPHRFELQVNFMKSNNNVDVLSGSTFEFMSNSSSHFKKSLPLDHDEIVKFSKYRCPVVHPAVIYRKNAVLDVGGYPKLYPEDYLLWIRMLLNGACFANLPNTILKMRMDDVVSDRRGFSFFRGEIYIFKYMYKNRFIGVGKLLTGIGGRIFLRLSPTIIKKFLYKYLR